MARPLARPHVLSFDARFRFKQGVLGAKVGSSAAQLHAVGVPGTGWPVGAAAYTFQYISVWLASIKSARNHL